MTYLLLLINVFVLSEISIVFSMLVVFCFSLYLPARVLLFLILFFTRGVGMEEGGWKENRGARQEPTLVES